MRKVIIALLAVAIIVAGVVGVGLLEANALVRSGIEYAGTRALGIKTTLGAARVRPFAGEVRLSWLHVADPPGFGTDPFLVMRSGLVQVSLGSLLKDRVVISKVRLEDIDVYLIRGEEGANYDAILSHLKQGKAKPPSEGRKFIPEVAPVGNERQRPLDVERRPARVPFLLFDRRRLDEGRRVIGREGERRTERGSIATAARYSSSARGRSPCRS